MNVFVRAIDRAKRNRTILTVMFIDIDDFKKINDKWRHAVGDAVLCEVTKRIINVSRSMDLFARISGDDFALLLEDMREREEICASANRYIAAFTEPLKVNDSDIFVTLSIGVALYPEQGSSYE